MDKGRREAFSDGVTAIIITIMVLELRAPHAPLFRFAAHWMSENHFAPVATALCGAMLLLARVLIAAPAPHDRLAAAMARDARDKVSIALHALAIGLALFVHPWIACALYVAVALIWLVPDRRVVKVLAR